MTDVLNILILGLVSASIYAVAASGLVVTYTTSGIFNFSHGAIAMFSAFVYWQLRSPDAWGLPAPIALVLTVFVFAPLLGVLIDRLIMRRLHDASIITKIVVTVGLLVALIQLATVIWPPDTVQASLPLFFQGHKVKIGSIQVPWHNLIVFSVAIVVAIGLRILLYRTKAGVAMRAVVDNRELAALNGADPDRVSALSWALGSMLAAVAGVLIAPILALDQVQLTLLVINAYAAALVGRLRSLPMMVVGAIILGIAREFVGSQYTATWPDWITNYLTVDTVPVIMLFVVLLVVPQERESLLGAAQSRNRIPKPTLREAVVAAAVLVAVAWIAPTFVHGNTLASLGYGVALAIVMLSLVPLVGYAGQISLAQLGFAGVGAVVMFKVGSSGNPLALLAVVAITAAIGALIALPALRLKGLYLALATMAFALFLEKAVFTHVEHFKDGDAAVARLHLPGVSFDSDRANLVLMALVFGLLGIGIVALRRGEFGRRLQAMKDSPAACATLGLDLTRTKLEIFALSSAIAGLGGALLAGWRGKVGPEQFSLLQGALPGLPVVLLAVVGGITAVAGALFGGIVLAMIPLVGDAVPSIRNLMTVLPGLVGISLARNPDGAVAEISAKVRDRINRTGTKGRHSGGSAPTVGSHLTAEDANGRQPVRVPELIGVGSRASPEEIRTLDFELGLATGRCHADSRDD